MSKDLSDALSHPCSLSNTASLHSASYASLQTLQQKQSSLAASYLRAFTSSGDRVPHTMTSMRQ